MSLVRQLLFRYSSGTTLRMLRPKVKKHWEKIVPVFSEVSAKKKKKRKRQSIIKQRNNKLEKLLLFLGRLLWKRHFFVSCTKKNKKARAKTDDDTASACAKMHQQRSEKPAKRCALLCHWISKFGINNTYWKDSVSMCVYVCSQGYLIEI